MKTIYVILGLGAFLFTSCNSADRQTPVVETEHPVHHIDSVPTDNTSVADSVNGNANVGMGGGN